MTEQTAGTPGNQEQTLDEFPFVKSLVLQIRAHDTFGAWERKSDRDVIDPFILDAERRRSIPIIGDPDPEVLWRLELYYNTLAAAIEVRTGVIVTPMMKIHHEGFGRVVLIAGRLIVVNKNLRDVHRFGFGSLEKLSSEGEKVIASAVEMLERFKEVANWG